MPVFTKEEDFKKFEVYKRNVIKAASHVDASGKPFVYFKEFQFLDKKLPMMLIDVQLALKNELLKGAVKPTSSGLVTLTASNELKFDADKGTLNRAKVKTALAKIGIDNVYVSPGETDDEAGGETTVQTAASEQAPVSPAKQGTVGAPKTGSVAPHSPQISSPSIAHPAPPKSQQAIDPSALNRANPTTQAVAAKNVLQPLSKIPDQKPTAASGTPAPLRANVPSPLATNADKFPQYWLAARKSWQDASDALDAQITRLQEILRKSGDTELAEIAEFGLNGVTGNHRVLLMAAFKDVDAAVASARASSAQKARAAVTAFQHHLESDPRVAACDENPFGVPMTIRSGLGGALANILKALSAA